VKRRMRVVVRAQETACKDLLAGDRERMKRLILSTDSDNIERGFIRCENGQINECRGNECSITLSYAGCDRNAVSFHTHPPKGNLFDFFSPIDMRNAWRRGGVSCIGYTRGVPQIKCVFSSELSDVQTQKVVDEVDRISEGYAEGFVAMEDKDFERIENLVARLEENSEVCVEDLA
jgi:hypothetical protein